MYFCAGAPITFQSLTHVPLDCTKLPEKTWGLTIGSLAVGGGRLTGIPAAPAALPTGERRWGVCMLTKELGVARVGAESTPAWGIGGGRRRLPQRRELRRGCGSG
jgi:hypothetical protein